jgi:hypothetical protein
MKDMKVHEADQGWEPGFHRAARTEGRRQRTHRCIACGAFVDAFPRFVPAAEGGAQPWLLMTASMNLHVLHGED